MPPSPTVARLNTSVFNQPRQPPLAASAARRWVQIHEGGRLRTTARASNNRMPYKGFDFSRQRAAIGRRATCGMQDDTPILSAPISTTSTTSNCGRVTMTSNACWLLAGPSIQQARSLPIDVSMSAGGATDDPATDACTPQRCVTDQSRFHGMIRRSSSLSSTVSTKPMMAIMNRPTYICSTENVSHAVQIM